MYVVVFKELGQQVNVWSGYHSIAEARSDVRESDMCIPMTWDYEIVSEETLLNRYEEEYYKEKENVA